MSDARGLVDRLADAHRKGRRLVLLFDYDGTLTPLVPRPNQAVLPEATRDALVRLRETENVIVGAVSGRSLKDLRARLKTARLAYLAGTSGLEVQIRRRRFTAPGAHRIAPLIRQVSRRLEELTESFPGAWVERKPLGVALHWRQVTPAARSRLASEARQALVPFGRRLKLVDGHLALEANAALGWSKGTAVRTILRHLPEPSAEVEVVYAGDGPNDRDAFDSVDRQGGTAIAVGPRAPSARVHLRSPRYVSRFLTALAEAVSR